MKLKDIGIEPEDLVDATVVSVVKEPDEDEITITMRVLIPRNSPRESRPE